MLKKIVALAAALFVFYTGFAQKKPEPGYVVLQNSDTLYGGIQFKRGVKTPGKIKFQNAAGEWAKYTPEDIKEFSSGNLVYVSASVQVEMSSRYTNDMNYSNKPKLETRSVFLETLVSGEKSLFVNNSASGFNNFYIQIDGRYELLLFKEYYKDIQATGRALTVNTIRATLDTYKRQLGRYLYLNAELSRAIQRSKYSRLDLFRLFKLYYKTSGKEMKKEGVPKRFSIEIGVFSGVDTESFGALPKTHMSYNMRSDFKMAAAPIFGLSFNYALTAGKNYISMLVRPSVGLLNSGGDIYLGNHGKDEFRHHLKLKYTLLNFEILPRYTFCGERLNKYLYAGVDFRLLLGKYAPCTVYMARPDEGREGEMKADPVEVYDSYVYGLVVGTGVEWKRFSLDCSYRFSGHKAWIKFGSVKTYGFGLRLGCRLSKPKDGQAI
ncbi:MAG: hypothetical protein MI784_12740 [Cytophagales bacterium]|nr:hypothetical protein [Cytophagales bacterium]